MCFSRRHKKDLPISLIKYPSCAQCGIVPYFTIQGATIILVGRPRDVIKSGTLLFLGNYAVKDDMCTTTQLARRNNLPYRFGIFAFRALQSQQTQL